MTSSSDAAHNRAAWDKISGEYQAKHAEFIGRTEPRWGMWQLPESELQVLGEVRGRDVLELGCGGAQWAILLAQRGARVVGLDNSVKQLEHARQLMAEAGVDFPLVHASAEEVPLPDESFDIVFCDHGAIVFGDPYLLVPEAARLLRPGGLFAFSHSSPLEWVCWDDAADGVDTRLHMEYFGMHRLEEGDGPILFNLPHGEWIRLFRANGFEIEDLIEVRPPEGAESTYRTAADTEWARSWPLEEIWKVRKGR
jgi:SAM-dependent methyltransferase